MNTQPSQALPAQLILEDGTVFRGVSFGAPGVTTAEVVFNTAMNGYTESLTDPSYVGQILVMTYPMVGNYGVPDATTDANAIELYREHRKICVSGLIVADYSGQYSHWNGALSLSDWLKAEQIPAIEQIDTRALTKHIRTNGSMPGTIVVGDAPVPQSIADPYEGVNRVAEVSCREIIRYGTGAKNVVMVDCGTKNNIIRHLIDDNFTLIRVPWDYDFTSIPNIDGIFLSNGPGDPGDCTVTIEHIRKSLGLQVPIFGICLGHQLLGHAIGGRIFKLKYGHRGHNQPVQMVGTNRCFITSQNHSYTLDQNTIPKDWSAYFVNLNDGTNEGIRHNTLPYCSVQFHPEACGGPTDTTFFFDNFKKLILSR